MPTIERHHSSDLSPIRCLPLLTLKTGLWHILSIISYHGLFLIILIVVVVLLGYLVLGGGWMVSVFAFFFFGDGVSTDWSSTKDIVRLEVLKLGLDLLFMVLKSLVSGLLSLSSLFLKSSTNTIVLRLRCLVLEGQWHWVPLRLIT
jgi:hypothetical protein